MAYNDDSDSRSRSSSPTAIKLLVAGGFGVGKTTLVNAVSEIEPLSTEETLTVVSSGVDDLTGVESKKATTVALDFGRITIDEHHILYLFGTPGQERFWYFWDDLARGALGAVVLVDTRRLSECFPSVDFFETRGIPFLVAVNEFETDPHRYAPDEVREALALAPGAPIVTCDARDRRSATLVLVSLTEHLIANTRFHSQHAYTHPARSNT
jgi:signal recognition particle receptor subunit beta